MQERKLPRFPTWLLYKFIRRDLAEDVSGDLSERYFGMVDNGHPVRAKIDYFYQVVSYLRPFAIRKSSGQRQNYLPMFKSYFTTSVRGMKNNKLHAGLNIAGLAVGMAITITIGLWIRDELSYEKHFENYSKIGRVLQHVTNNGEVGTWWSVPWPLAEELRKNYGSNFSHVVLTTSVDNRVLSYGDKHLNETGIFAEDGYAELFTLKMIRGTGSLKEPTSMLISESLARTYFDNEDPLGKTIIVDREMTVQVTGVYKDIPDQSEFKDTDYIIPWVTLYNGTGWIRNMRDPWRPNPFSLYVGIADNRSFEQVSANIRDAKLKKVSPELAKKKPVLFVHPMERWHLYSDFKNGFQDGGLITYVWLFAIIAGFVILMACINFMNLSTARSEKRSREIGIRKVVGSLKSQLVQQFFSESILTAFCAFVIALLLVQLSLPAFNLLAGKETSLPWTSALFWISGLGLCIFIGIVSGIYPALYLSSIKAGKALKGTYKASKSSSIPRKAMVVMQFAVSIIMIVGTAVVFQQIQYAKNRPIGYETNGLVSIVSGSEEFNKHYDAVKEELLNTGVISSMAEADAPTTESSYSTSTISWQGKDPNLSVDFAALNISHDYGKTIAWEIIDGRDFDRNKATDSAGLVINESAAHFMGLKQPVGEIIRWFDSPMPVIGVIKDIVTNSPFERVRPTLYTINSDAGAFLLFRIHPDKNASQALASIERMYKKYNPETPFTYSFIDEAYARKFGDEERVGKLAGVFTSLAIFVSCLGIFGLSSFVAEQRTREIGIRKVHGATVYQVWKLVSRDFVLLAVIACVVALPVGYYLAAQWVSRYTYHTNVSWAILGLASVCVVAITLTTVSWHTVQAARMNPVKSLRVE